MVLRRQRRQEKRQRGKSKSNEKGNKTKIWRKLQFIVKYGTSEKICLLSCWGCDSSDKTAAASVFPLDAYIPGMVTWVGLLPLRIDSGAWNKKFRFQSPSQNSTYRIICPFWSRKAFHTPSVAEKVVSDLKIHNIAILVSIASCCI